MLCIFQSSIDKRFACFVYVYVLPRQNTLHGDSALRSTSHFYSRCVSIWMLRLIYFVLVAHVYKTFVQKRTRVIECIQLWLNISPGSGSRDWTGAWAGVFLVTWHMQICLQMWVWSVSVLTYLHACVLSDTDCVANCVRLHALFMGSSDSPPFFHVAGARRVWKGRNGVLSNAAPACPCWTAAAATGEASD